MLPKSGKQLILYLKRLLLFWIFLAHASLKQSRRSSQHSCDFPQDLLHFLSRLHITLSPLSDPFHVLYPEIIL
jgi:hypothetical protein